MSAFTVPPDHIDVMVSAGIRPRHTLRWPTVNPVWAEAQGEPVRSSSWWRDNTRELRPENADSVCAMLIAENWRSVNHRYREDEIEFVHQFRDTDTYDSRVVLKAIRCYEYQSCEHPEWGRSEAKQFCDALTIMHIGILTGDSDGWPIGEARYRSGISITDMIARRQREG